MFGPPGHVYVYFTYGMHFCMNLVCGPPGRASAVLLRAGEVIDGLETAQARRPRARPRDLARGPARLTLSMAVDRAVGGADVTSRTGALQVRAGTPVPDLAVCRGPRVGVSTGAGVPWRFWIDGDPTVSVYRAHVARKRGSTGDRRRS
jgi:DNA-3-methyladenine glycosylase